MGIKRKSIVFTGGGTAGHVIVNLALIPHFQEEGWQIDYIGSKTGIEKELVGETANITYHPISTGKLRRYLSLENMKDPFKVIKGTFEAWQIIRALKPNIVFSKGGFVSVPVIVAARLARVPTIIHESDLTPGLANKLAAPFASKILTTFPETAKRFSKEKAEYVGAIIREELFHGEKERGYQFINWKVEKPVLLIMGGSSGSQKINQVIRGNLDKLLEQFMIVHICGRDNVDETMNKQGYAQFEYVNEELKDIFAITDFVISRAGANAIFEFLALNIPMLLIPLSLQASRGDQIANAVSFRSRGLAEVLREEDVTDAAFMGAIADLVDRAPIMQDQMKKYASSDAQISAIQAIKDLAN